MTSDIPFISCKRSCDFKMNTKPSESNYGCSTAKKKFVKMKDCFDVIFFYWVFNLLRALKLKTWLKEAVSQPGRVYTVGFPERKFHQTSYVQEFNVYYSLNLYTLTIPKAELVEVLLCSALISVIRNKIPAKIMVYKTPTSEMHKTIHNGTNVISHGHEMTLKK